MFVTSGRATSVPELYSSQHVLSHCNQLVTENLFDSDVFLNSVDFRMFVAAGAQTVNSCPRQGTTAGVLLPDLPEW